MIIKNRFGVPKRFFALYPKLDFLKMTGYPTWRSLTREAGNEGCAYFFVMTFASMPSSGMRPTKA